MAAGLGLKTFVTGDVLTAADTNGYLMQGVWVFADAAARTAAVTSPQEGNMSYLKDTNSTEYYSGSAWVAVAGASGGWTLASTTTLSGSSTSLTIPSGYKQVVVWINNYQITASAYPSITFNSNTGSVYNEFKVLNTGSSSTNYFGVTTSMGLAGGSALDTGNNKNVYQMIINNPDDTSSYKNVSAVESVLSSAQRLITFNTPFLSTTAITTMQVKAGASTWAAGTAYVYGVK